MMLKRIVSNGLRAAVLGGGIAFTTIPSSDGFSATLRNHVVVHGDQVHLGDLFDGAGQQQDTVIFRAPAPGKSILLTTRSLRRLARAYKLDWRPRSNSEESTVKRSSNPVDRAQITSALHSALRSRIADTEDYEISLDDPTLRIDLPVHMPAKAMARELHYDPRNRRFSATVVAPDGRPGAVRVPVAGKVHRLVAVPVLSRRLRSGDIIRASDIKTKKMRSTVVDRNALTEPAHIIGKSARRSLQIDRPVRNADVREPMLVRRGGLVTMSFKTANMVLTAQGKSRENGAKGDTVRVFNTNSGKIVEATVTGLGLVTVGPVGQATGR